MKPLTPADRDALQRLPKGWFEARDVPFMVRNARFRRDRLVERKKLERRVVGGDFFDLRTQFRRLP